jgi:hypothetical protein
MFRMSGGPDREKIRTAISAHIEPGEPVEGIFTAVMPGEGRSGGLAFGGLGLVVMAVEYAMRRSSVRKTVQAAGVPLARRMIIALTPRRLVIAQADRGWRLRTITGDLPRDQIAKVELGAASDRTRRAILHLNTGGSITLRMTRAGADQLRDHLS